MNMSLHGAPPSRPTLPHEAMRNTRPTEPMPDQTRAGTLSRTREPIPPFSDFVEVRCEDCDGTGYDVGSHQSFDPEDCPRCGGSGKELIFRNYLAEAFRIVSDPECKVEPCRQQMIALATYARQTVSALFSAEPTSTTVTDRNNGGDGRW